MTNRLTIRRPDDWHVHLRDGAMMQDVVTYTAAQFARAIVMPNLAQPVVTAADAEAYRARIMAALPQGADFTPLMTAYLTDTSNTDDIASGFERGIDFRHGKLHGQRGNRHRFFPPVHLQRSLGPSARFIGSPVPDPQPGLILRRDDVGFQ